MVDLTQHVPPEILTEIFEQLYRLSLGPPDSAFVHGRRIRKLCWPVSRVCRYWREAALAAPFLWAYLPLVNLDDDKPPSPGERLECIQTLVPRCKDAPLHVSFVCAPEANFYHTQEVHCYLHDRAEQWRSLGICAAAQDIELILEDVFDRIPLLEELRINFVDGEDADRALQMFKVAPMLRSVHLSGAGNEWNLLLDTRSLVHVRDDMGALMHNIEPVHGFLLLTTLEIHDRDLFNYDALSEEIEENAITFPALKTLKYYCHDSFSAESGFLQFPVTPMLEDLSVEAEVGDVVALLLEIQERSGSMPLKTLHLKIEMDECVENDFTDLLRYLPGLEVLDVDLPCMDDIALLSVAQGPEVLVPRLRKCSFRFHGDNFDGIHIALTQLASARCEPSCCTDAVPDETRAALMELFFRADIYMDPRTRPGFGHDQYHYLGMQPTRLEPWYGERHPRVPWNESDLPRSAYTEAEATIPHMVLQGLGVIGTSSKEYQHTLELLTRVEQKYKPTQLVDFLETNINICLISLAYVFKTQLPNKYKTKEITPYKRITRLLKEVRTDLMQRLDEFHWIWETTPNAYTIRYIPDQHEMRADRVKFADAVLGLSDDQWLLDDL